MDKIIHQNNYGYLKRVSDGRIEIRLGDFTMVFNQEDYLLFVSKLEEIIGRTEKENSKGSRNTCNIEAKTYKLQLSLTDRELADLKELFNFSTFSDLIFPTKK